MQESGAYGRLAEVYDILNAELDYSAWADRIVACFEQFAHRPPELVLDLACGTGRMTRELARRGYDMIGVDGSADMLSEAMQYLPEEGQRSPLYLMQDMRSFELYGTVGAVVCCLDSINYLTGNGDLETCFKTVCNYLDPGGVFVFDVSTPYRFEHIFADNAYVLEDEKRGIYCGWQNCYDENSGICDFLLTVFRRRDDGSYDRFDEQQTERCYSREQLQRALEAAGLELVSLTDTSNASPPNDRADRWHLVARRPIA